MKKITIILAAAAAVLCSCSKETQTPMKGTSEGPQTITASIGDASTKVCMNDDGTAVSYTWKKGDRVFFVNTADCTDSVRYVLSSGEGASSAVFTRSSGEFTNGSTYTFCHIGNGVRISADGKFTDKDGKPILKGQNPVHIENYMVFAGYSGSPKAYSFTFDGSNVPTRLGFESVFSMLKVGVSNESAAAVTPAGLKADAGKGSGYFLGTLRIDAATGVAASDPVDYLQTGIWDGEAIAAGSEGAYSFICVQNPSRTFSSLKVSIFY